MWRERRAASCAEVVVHKHLGGNTEIPKHFLHGTRHGAGTAHIIFDVFGRLVVFEVMVVKHLMDKSGITCPVVFGLRIGKGNIELEIGEIALDSPEIFFVKYPDGNVPRTNKRFYDRSYAGCGKGA